MTTIIALKESGKIYIGTDTCVFIGDMTLKSTHDKIFKKGGMLIGCAGHTRFNKLIRYNMVIPEKEESMDDATYMNTIFVDALCNLLDDKQFNTKSDSRVSSGNCAIVCYNGGIYVISSDYDATQYDSEFMAIGSGVEYAISSLETTKGLITDPEARIELALSVASKYDCNTRKPFKILSI